MTIDAAFTQFPSLTTKRLYLRNIVPGDAKALFAILSDRQVTEFYGDEPHQSFDETQELLKLGFTYEGYLRQRYAFRDRFEDKHYFGLLEDEWDEQV